MDIGIMYVYAATNLEALKVNDDNKKHTYMYRRAWKTFIALQLIKTFDRSRGKFKTNS